MLTGAHVILYSTDADADRAFLEDMLALPHVDVRSVMQDRGLSATEVMERGCGRLGNVTLPSGTALGVYQPRHASPPPTR